MLIINFCGERGIRTPGNLRFNGFQDRRIRPLCHLSGCKINVPSLYLPNNNLLELISRKTRLFETSQGAQ